MQIGDLLVGRNSPIEQQRIKVPTVGDVQSPEGGSSFVNTLKEFIGDTNSTQKDAAEMTDRMLKGEAVDLHDVMISAEKAKTTFQLLLELRNNLANARSLTAFNRSHAFNQLPQRCWHFPIFYSRIQLCKSVGWMIARIRKVVAVGDVFWILTHGENAIAARCD